MATVYFRIKETQKEETPIYVRLSINSKVRPETQTGFTINKKYWSDDTNLPKQSGAKNKKLKASLKKLDSYLLEQYNDIENQNVDIDTKWLKQQIDNCFDRVVKSTDTSVKYWYQFIIDNAKIRERREEGKIGISERRKSSYLTSLRVLKEYEKHIKKEIHFSDLSRTFVTEFKRWLLDEDDKGYSLNYAGKQISNLKSVTREAKKHDIKINPQVLEISSFSESKGNRYFVTLSFDELKKIKETKLTGYLDNARKWLLIGCAIGQRGGDLLNITQKNIRTKGGNLYVELVQQKTGKEVTVGVYSDDIKNILLNDMPTKLSTQKFNDYLKKVCEKAGIDEPTLGKKQKGKKGEKRNVLAEYPKYELISSHVCRRSFATNHYKKIPTPMLMETTGHSEESIFLEYIGKPKDKDFNADLFIKLAKEMM